MVLQLPSYDSYQPNSHPKRSHQNQTRYGIKVARSMDDIMRVLSIRSAVFISEQECPYDEEFDGNDFSSTHLLGYVDDEPVACIRIRFFAGFAKIERLAVRHEYRNSRLSFKMVRAAIELARKKGYRKLYGHAQKRLVRFWSRFGFKPVSKDVDLVFSDFAYQEMVNEVEPHNDPISIETDPYVIIRPEGRWHEAGILEKSSVREVTSPLSSQIAA